MSDVENESSSGSLSDSDAEDDIVGLDPEAAQKALLNDYVRLFHPDLYSQPYEKLKEDSHLVGSARVFAEGTTTNFRSAHFDPSTALYTVGLMPPIPHVRPLDNIYKAALLVPSAEDRRARIGKLHSRQVAYRDAAFRMSKQHKVIVERASKKTAAKE